MLDVIQKGTHCAYLLNYHIVIIPKYRKSILIPPISTFFEEQLLTICNNYEWIIHALEIRPDHVHLFLAVNPSDSPSQIIGRLKSLTARALFDRFPLLRLKEYWGSKFWSRGYFIGTAGAVSSNVIRRYIENQDHS